MATIDQLQVEITAITKDFNRSIDGVKGKLSELGSTGDQASTRMMAGFDKVGAVATKSLKIGVVGAVAAIAASIPSAVRRIDTLNNSARTFANMGFDAETSAKSVEALNQSIMGLPTPLDSAIRGMTSLAATYGDIEKGQKVFTSLNNAILGFGGSAVEVDNAILQLSQLPMDGPLDAQTWNSLRNSGLTPVLVAMGKEFGMSVNDMKAAFGSGTLTVSDFTDKLVEMNEKGGGGLKSLKDIAKDSTAGIGTGFQNMKTAITRGIAEIVEAIGSENISTAIANIGKAFAAVLVAVAGLVTFISDNSDIFGPLTVGIGVAIAAILAYNAYVKISAIVTAAWSAASTYMTLVASLQSQGLGLLKAAWLALNIVMKANPIGLVITAVVAITSALVYFFTQTETGRKIFEVAMNGIKRAAQVVWNWIKGNWPLLLGILTGPIGLAVGMIIRHANTIKQAFSNALNWVKGVWNGAPGFFSGIVSRITGFFASIPGKIKNFFVNALNSVKNIDWAGLGRDIVAGIAAGLNPGAIMSKMKGIATSALSAAKDALGIKSPSRVMRDQVGKMMGAGMAEGIDQSTRDAVKSASGSAKRVLNAYDGSFTTKLPTARELSGKLDMSVKTRLTEIDGRPMHVTVMVGEDTLVDKVVNGINNQSFMSNGTVIRV